MLERVKSIRDALTRTRQAAFGRELVRVERHGRELRELACWERDRLRLRQHGGLRELGAARMRQTGSKATAQMEGFRRWRQRNGCSP